MSDTPTPTPTPLTTFNPASREQAETFARELTARTGRPFTRLVHWATGCEVHTDRQPERPGDTITVQMLRPGEWWCYGWASGREVSRTGRYHGVGPAALAWVLARILATDLAEPATPSGE